MKVNIEIIEINEMNELYDVVAYTGTCNLNSYMTDDLFSNPVIYETKDGHKMAVYTGLAKEELEKLSLADILKAMELS